MRRFNIAAGDKSIQERFSHSYYQGLLVEIGNMRENTTYIPAQDRHHRFLDKELGEISSFTELPTFTYDNLMRRARTVGFIWFNRRMMPSHFYELEHTTDIAIPSQNSTSCRISSPTSSSGPGITASRSQGARAVPELRQSGHDTLHVHAQSRGHLDS